MHATRNCEPVAAAARRIKGLAQFGKLLKITRKYSHLPACERLDMAR
jgi:hypothetical protein